MAVLTKSYKVVVVGAGSGGLAVAAALGRRLGKGNVAVVDDSKTHYYQPLWTLVGGGLKKVEDSARSMESVMSRDVDWLKTKAAGFMPEENTVVTASGDKVKYDHLVVATGVQIDWHMIDGLKDALEANSVVSNYSPKYVTNTFQHINSLQNGNAIFTFPSSPVKCAGAPQKIMYMAEHNFRNRGVRDNVNVMFNHAGDKIFGVAKYAKTLAKICEDRKIELNFARDLVAVRHASKEGVFKNLKTGQEEVFKYDFMHVTPHMGPIEIMKGSPIANAAGWVDVNPATLQHAKYENIFALGDCTSAPTSKTAAAISSQNMVVRRNLLAHMQGKPMPEIYDGYTSCPLVTGYGELILAEFDYDGKPLETFPVDQGIPRRIMYHLKKDLMPPMYWYGLLNGYWNGPKLMRKLLKFDPMA
eukprot:comp20780_c0_seq1/m.27292 comp20780_c0_seq1/g.27292  ORF comp20780_c0_seq1/g.27292 comp20780_c0_seq1/m.27292 type:complete len:415 (-) comp20780_c0_seq1:627-1871(-)